MPKDELQSEADGWKSGQIFDVKMSKESEYTIKKKLGATYTESNGH